MQSTLKSQMSSENEIFDVNYRASVLATIPLQSNCDKPPQPYRKQWGSSNCQQHKSHSKRKQIQNKHQILSKNIAYLQLFEHNLDFFQKQPNPLILKSLQHKNKEILNALIDDIYDLKQNISIQQNSFNMRPMSSNNRYNNHIKSVNYKDRSFIDQNINVNNHCNNNSCLVNQGVKLNNLQSDNLSQCSLTSKEQPIKDEKYTIQQTINKQLQKQYQQQLRIIDSNEENRNKNFSNKQKNKQIQVHITSLDTQIKKIKQQNQQCIKEITSLQFYKEWKVMTDEIKGAQRYDIKLNQEIVSKEKQINELKNYRLKNNDLDKQKEQIKGYDRINKSGDNNKSNTKSNNKSSRVIQNISKRNTINNNINSYNFKTINNNNRNINNNSNDYNNHINYTKNINNNTNNNYNNYTNITKTVNSKNTNLYLQQNSTTIKNNLKIQNIHRNNNNNVVTRGNSANSHQNNYHQDNRNNNKFNNDNNHDYHNKNNKNNNNNNQYHPYDDYQNGNNYKFMQNRPY